LRALGTHLCRADIERGALWQIIFLDHANENYNLLRSGTNYPAISFHRQIKQKGRDASMAGDEELRAVVADIRLIAADCFDLRAVERLRLLVEQIEKRMLGARAALTTQDRNQGGGFRSI
jgi:hypothetical protein